MSDTRQKQEVIGIILAAMAGEASDEQLALINRLILEDEEYCTLVLHVISQEAWLTWHATEAQGLQQLMSQISSLNNSNAVTKHNQVLCTQEERFGDAITAAFAEQPLNQNETLKPSNLGRNLRGKNLRSSPSVAAALLIGLGAVMGALTTRWFVVPNNTAMPFADADGDASKKHDGQPHLAGYQARLGRGTACVWAPEMRSRIGSQDELQSGDSLNLIAGLAELELSWPMRGKTSLRLEGPAGLVLIADGGTSLNYGKLIADVLLEYDSFTVETPAGRVEVTGDANFGVVASSGTVEVHVFRGQAEVVTPWMSSAEKRDKLIVRSGRSIRLSAKKSGELNVDRGPALLNRFASQVSMTSDVLDISDEYVEMIKQAGPLVYWRFNRPMNNDTMQNEMGTLYGARVIGKPSWVDEHGNSSVEFGAGLNADELRAYLVSDTPFLGIESNAYTVELWAKPSHYHLGTMVSLVGGERGDGKEVVKGAHGVLLELGGLRGYYSNIEYPGRVRFLHRDPPSGDASLGNSCFSSGPYVLRKWQHIVAVKDKSEIRLYVDGKLVASAADNSKLSNGLELLLGQMDRERDWRPYVGQLDELAFYPRPLSEEEIKRHHQLIRPTKVSVREI